MQRASRTRGAQYLTEDVAISVLYGIEMLCGVSETKRIFYVFVFTEEEAKIGNFRGWIYS